MQLSCKWKVLGLNIYKYKVASSCSLSSLFVFERHYPHLHLLTSHHSRNTTVLPLCRVIQESLLGCEEMRCHFNTLHLFSQWKHLRRAIPSQFNWWLISRKWADPKTLKAQVRMAIDGIKNNVKRRILPTCKYKFITNIMTSPSRCRLIPYHSRAG
jgi:hypothetical protein